MKSFSFKLLQVYFERDLPSRRPAAKNNRGIRRTRSKQQLKSVSQKVSKFEINIFLKKNQLKHGLGADVSVGHFDWDAERRYFPVKAWSWNYVWAVSMMPSETHRVLPQKKPNCTFLFLRVAVQEVHGDGLGSGQSEEGEAGSPQGKL